MPLQKIAKNLQPGRAGFFGMELDAQDVAALDGRGEGLNVLRRWRRCRR